MTTTKCQHTESLPPKTQGNAVGLVCNRFVRLRVWLRNLRHWKTGRAIRDLERAFQSDDGFVLTWKCNIAMTLIDRTRLSRDEANDAADHLMRHLFGVKPNRADMPFGRE